jgi:GNAT superfamily N-acetyltransferase
MADLEERRWRLVVTDRPRHRVRLAVSSDLERMLDSLVEAFMSDPVVVWMYPDEHQRGPSLREWYRLTLRAGLRAGHTYTVSEGQGVAVWSPPSVPYLFDPRIDGEAIAETLRRHLGNRTKEVFEGLMVFEGSHPREVPHFYLSMLGTAPRMQGKGLGGALLDEVLWRCDADGWPAYLETTLEQNVRFYERRGFRVTGDSAVPAGPRIWFMWREPEIRDHLPE